MKDIFEKIVIITQFYNTAEPKELQTAIHNGFFSTLSLNTLSKYLTKNLPGTISFF